MNETSALLLVVAISVALSTATIMAIYAPLRRLLEAICPQGSTAEFWSRAAVTVLYLLPLWVVLIFGMPGSRLLASLTVGEVARRGLAAASFALVAVVIATGLRLANARPAMNDYPPPVR
jgi:hypothetical protein